MARNVNECRVSKAGTDRAEMAFETCPAGERRDRDAVLSGNPDNLRDLFGAVVVSSQARSLWLANNARIDPNDDGRPVLLMIAPIANSMRSKIIVIGTDAVPLSLFFP